MTYDHLALEWRITLRASALRSDFKTAFYPTHSLVVMIQAFVRHGDIRMQQAYIPTHAGNMFFERTYAQFHIRHVVPDSPYVGTDRPQVLKDDVFYVVGHGVRLWVHAYSFHVHP